MIKLVYCFRRRPDLSVEEFSEYWQNVHGPVGARIPGVSGSGSPFRVVTMSSRW